MVQKGLLPRDIETKIESGPLSVSREQHPVIRFSADRPAEEFKVLHPPPTLIACALCKQLSCARASLQSSAPSVACLRLSEMWSGAGFKISEKRKELLGCFVSARLLRQQVLGASRTQGSEGAD